MVVAAERFVAAHPAHPGTLAFLLTSDEEGIARDGTRRVVETLAARGTPLTWCLVGEPSSQLELGDLLRHGRRGSLNGRLLVQGVQGHVAYPERACNPIHAASDVLARLVSTTWDDGNAYFPATSFQVSNLHAGTGAENVIPATLQAWFNFRYSTASTADDLKRRVHALCDAAGLNYRIDWHLSGEPFLTPRGVLVQAVTESIRACLGREPALSTGGGTSDGRFIAKTGCEVVELGPVNASIHKVDECVAVDDLEALAGVYADVLARLLRSG
jgi:succinyl-diaminopimelate desuccinylase